MKETKVKQPKKSIVTTAAAAMLALSIGPLSGLSSAASGYMTCDRWDGPLYTLVGTDSDTKVLGGAANVHLYGYNSLGCDSEIISYTWDFGDGTTGEGKDVTHTYGVGSFQPTLTIKNADGDTYVRSLNQTIVVRETNNIPVASDFQTTVSKDNYFFVDLETALQDLDGDSLSISDVQVVSGDFVVRPASLDSTKVYVYGVDEEGGDQSATFTYSVNDGFGGVAQGEATINADNKAPVITNNPTHNTYEDMVHYFYLRPADVATDIDSATLTLDMPGRSLHGTITTEDASRSYYKYTPDTNFNGTDIFKVPVTDGYERSMATVTLNVKSQNDAPVVQDLALITMFEDGDPVTFNPLEDARDVDGDILKTVFSEQPSGAGRTVINEDGTVTFTPNANYSGTATVQYAVSDGTTVVSKRINITVTPVNDAPQIAEFYLSAPNKRTFNYRATANDIENENLTYSWDFGDGKVSSSYYGVHTYAKRGTYTVKLTVSDTSGATVVRTSTITIQR